MTKKIYRTANGKMVDIGALQLQNENIRAVGNMGVNARGDIIDSRNKILDSRNRQVAKQYRRQTNVSDTPVVTGQKSPTVDTQPVAKDNPKIEKNASAEVPQSQAPVTGLAAAIAKAREIKQESLAPAPSRSSDSITKI